MLPDEIEKLMNRIESDLKILNEEFAANEITEFLSNIIARLN